MRISPFRSTSRSTLYRTAGWRVILGVFALCTFLQTTFPVALPAQVGHAAKTSKGPRALGLLELGPNGNARLIPIAILIDGKYYDASAYKAAPVPMALWADTVYEGIRTGVSMGLFTVTAPQQRKDESGATIWWADGRWQTAESIKAMAARKRPVPSTPRGMNDDEGPPVLRRAGAEKPKPPETPPAPTTQPPPASAPAPTPTATPSAAPGASAASSPATAPPSQNDQAPADKDRPTLKRGQAGATSAEEAQKKVSTSASVGAGTAAASPTSPPTTSPSSSAAQPASQAQLIPAISDPQPSDSLPYNYKMSPQEEEQFRKKMLAMAADEIRARAAQLAPGSAAAKPVQASSPRSKATAAKPVQPTFEDVQLHVFDLSDINEPELVLTAKARMPQSSHGKDSTNPGLQYMITLVVRDDVNGELHKSLANVTDTQHLDVIPRLDLIDAVDVDGDGRAELLFHEVSDTGSAFVVYRVIGNQLYPLFQGSL
jgi:hypothetical protein